MIKKQKDASGISVWDHFRTTAELTREQFNAFKQYYALLQEWNAHTNITALENERSIVRYHFEDSLQLSRVVSMKDVHAVADVGSGGGFPGIPLAIKYPDLRVVLIEVNNKKIAFLKAVIMALNLSDRVTVYEKDWRTFLRTTDEDIPIFCARASLQPEELLRMFKPSSPYKQSQLVYFASEIWEPSQAVAPFIKNDVLYRVGHKKRRLVLCEAS